VRPGSTLLTPKALRASQYVLAIDSDHLRLQWWPAAALRRPGGLTAVVFASSRLRPRFGRQHAACRGARTVHVLTCTACRGSDKGGNCVRERAPSASGHAADTARLRARTYRLCSWSVLGSCRRSAGTQHKCPWQSDLSHHCALPSLLCDLASRGEQAPCYPTTVPSWDSPDKVSLSLSPSAFLLQLAWDSAASRSRNSSEFPSEARWARAATQAVAICSPSARSAHAEGYSGKHSRSQLGEISWVKTGTG